MSYDPTILKEHMTSVIDQFMQLPKLSGDKLAWAKEIEADVFDALSLAATKLATGRAKIEAADAGSSPDAGTTRPSTSNSSEKTAPGCFSIACPHCK